MPRTSSLALGTVVPIPTLPVEAMVTKLVGVEPFSISNLSPPEPGEPPALIMKRFSAFKLLGAKIKEVEALVEVEYMDKAGETEA